MLVKVTSQSTDARFDLITNYRVPKNYSWSKFSGKFTQKLD